MGLTVKAFREDRSHEAPQWKEVQRFLTKNKLRSKDIVTLAAYPTGEYHNLVVIFDSKKTGTSTSED